MAVSTSRRPRASCLLLLGALSLPTAGAVEFTVEAQAPTYFALDLDGSSTRDDANNLVGQAGPYVVKIVGPDDRGTETTRTKLKVCEGTTNCYFSTTDMFTLKPSSEYTITVYHCKYDTPFNNVAYVWNAQQYGAGAAARDACAASADNHYASVVSTKTTIASTNDKTSITYGFATLESIITEEVTFVDGGMGYKLGRTENDLVVKTNEDKPILSMRKLEGSV